jgi:outer membrane protein
MKNISLILNAVLLVAVGVLFYLHFSGRSSETSDSSSTTPGTIPSDIKIAYIKSDTVLKYYDFYKANSDAFESKQKKAQQALQDRVAGLQNEAAAYQRNVGSMTLSQVKAVEEDLGKKQQNLQLYERSLSQQLMEEQAKMSQELYDRITAFLKKYGAENNLQVVLKYDPSSDVLYGGEALDITKPVIDGLNAEYKTEKSAGDSTATKKK